MKVKIKIPTEVEISHVRMSVAVRYDEEDMPNDFPFREGDMWNVTIEIDTGKIVGWPEGKSWDLDMKVCDEGSYYLLAADGSTISGIQAKYVPNGVIPGRYGDYVQLNINKNGAITNWPLHPNLSAFFGDAE